MVFSVIAYGAVLNMHLFVFCSCYHISGIIRGRKVLQITFFAIVREKTFAIQAISSIKIPTKIKVQENILECFQIHKICKLFSVDNSHYTVF